MRFTIRMKVLVLGLASGLFAAALCGAPSGRLLPSTKAQEATVPTRRALLVGISNYEAGTNRKDRWGSLNTGPDLEHMRYVLETYYDFKGKESLHTLRNEQATQAETVREFNEHLIAKAKPGDVVVFYYTGHGFHVPDVSGDEAADREDEVTVMWVPSDKQSLPDAPRRSMMYMLDDTYERLLRELAQKMRGADGKVQGSITVIFDSCNSGSATKALLIPKGRDWDPAVDGPRPAAANRPDPASGWLSHGSGQLEGATFIAGSQSNQYSYMMPESETQGSILTYHLTRYLTNIGRAQPARPVTYRDMHERISAQVLGFGRAQDPQVEGNIDSQIFGDGRPVKEQTLPAVRRVQPGATPRLELNVGSLHGIARGARFDIYKNGSDVKNPANKLGELVLDEVGPTSSAGNVVKPVSATTPLSDYEAAQAVVTLYRFDGQPLKVLIQRAAAAEAGKAKALSDALTAQAFVTRSGVTEKNFDVLLGWCKEETAGWCRDNRGKFFYQRRDGKFVSLGSTLDGPALQKRLLTAWRWRHFANLNLSPASPVRINVVGRNGAPLKEEGGRHVLRPGDEAKITVTNGSGAPVFVTILYLKDDGGIVVWPGRRMVNGQQPLNADNRAVDVLKLSNITAPNGDEVEIFKLIATPRPVDFTGMSFGEEERKGIKAMGPKNPLEDLLFGLVDSKAKGGEVEPIEIDEWYTDQVTYVIKATQPERRAKGPEAARPATPGSITRRGLNLSRLSRPSNRRPVAAGGPRRGPRRLRRPLRA